MNKKYIIVGIVVIIAVWAGFSWNKKSAVAPQPEVGGNTEVATTSPNNNVEPSGEPKATTSVSPTMMKDGSYIVYYTARGFNPKFLSIKKGKAVHFINSSNKAMRIATTDKTNSQAYSELNQTKTVGRGGTYDFTFLASGIWGYMNSNNPTDTGMIVVQ